MLNFQFLNRASGILTKLENKMSKEKALDRQATICGLASAVKNICVNAAIDGGGLIANHKERMDSMITAAGECAPNLLESIGEDNAGGVFSAWQTSIQSYADTYGKMPSDEVLASAMHTANQGVSASNGSGLMFESVQGSLATSEGTPIRPRSIGLILPTLLSAATTDMVTHIPAERDEVEIFEINRIAGTTFGDFNAGEVIAEGSTGQYGNMRQLYAFAAEQQPDNSKTSFEFDTATHAKVKTPIKRGSVVIYLDSKPVAQHLRASNNMSLITLNDSGIGGTVDLTNGKVTVTASTAPAKGVLSIKLEVDIEKAYELIPTIQAEVESYTLTPSWSVLGSEHTIQSFWTLNREMGVDLGSQLMANQRNLLAYNKDIANLTTAIHASYANKLETFPLTISANHTFREHYQRLEEKINAISTEMLSDTKKSGVVGIYAGADAINILKAMGSPFFEVAPNYREVNRIHYVGRLFGRFKVFVNPHAISIAGATFDSWDLLFYGRGENHSEAGIVNGDAIAPTFIHQGAKGFQISNALISLRYQELHPNKGEKYFRRMKLIPS